MNQTCIISLPCRRDAPEGHEPSARGLRPRLSSRTQTRCECQRVSGPPGVGPAMRAHAEHRPDEHERPAGRVRVDQRLGPPRVEEPTVSAETSVLGVEVVDGQVARPSRDARRCEPVARGRACVLPTSRGQPQPCEQAARRSAAQPWPAPARGTAAGDGRGRGEPRRATGRSPRRERADDGMRLRQRAQRDRDASTRGARGPSTTVSTRPRPSPTMATHAKATVAERARRTRSRGICPRA